MSGGFKTMQYHELQVGVERGQGDSQSPAVQQVGVPEQGGPLQSAEVQQVGVPEQEEGSLKSTQESVESPVEELELVQDELDSIADRVGESLQQASQEVLQQDLPLFSKVLLSELDGMELTPGEYVILDEISAMMLIESANTLGLLELGPNWSSDWGLCDGNCYVVLLHTPMLDMIVSDQERLELICMSLEDYCQIAGENITQVNTAALEMGFYYKGSVYLADQGENYLSNLRLAREKQRARDVSKQIAQWIRGSLLLILGVCGWETFYNIILDVLGR